MPSRPQLDELRGSVPVILPSLLLCDFANLADEIRKLEDAGVKAFHLDVMDGHFVPNLTYGLPIVEAVRRSTSLPIDVHLMISEPGRYMDQFVQAGADVVTFHVEAEKEARPLLERVRTLGAGAGIALNPDTPLSAIDDCLDTCDLVLVMSVMPGFGGQSFQPVALEKLRNLSERVSADVLLAVDGGVNRATIGSCAEAGAQLFVVGSAIFGQGDYAESVPALAQLAQHHGRTHTRLWSRSY